MIPTTESVQFLTTLTARANGYLTLTALPPDRATAAPSRHVPLSDPDALQQAVEALHHANQRGWGGVFSVATRAHDRGRWRRGGLSDLHQLPALFVDLDHPPHEALPRLRDHPLPPSAIVLSGGGVHAYWWLTTPTSDWDTAQSLLNQLAHTLQGDRTHPAGAMRLPGTRNNKPIRHGAQCALHTLTDRHYDLEDFLPVPLPIRDPPSVRSPRSTQLNPHLLEVVTQRLLVGGGYVQRNGWIASCCPCGHTHDRPGAHFAFHPTWGIGVCHGRHGRLLLRDLCHHLALNPVDYGGLYA